MYFSPVAVVTRQPILLALTILLLAGVGRGGLARARRYAHRRGGRRRRLLWNMAPRLGVGAGDAGRGGAAHPHQRDRGRARCRAQILS